jgi:hypothetical protein
MAGVGINHGMEEAIEGATELHCLRRGLLVHHAVGAAPGVVVDQAVPPSGLGYTADRTEAEVGQVPGLAPWEEADVPKGDLFGEFLADLGGGMSGGAVTAVREGGLQVLGRSLWRALGLKCLV